jgi:DNA helicase-2/ATP-dependent DNA helicase PcrA
MAKGLEFDEVIVPHAGRNNYKTDMDRSMLYIAVTRAMHKLTLTCTGSLTRLVGPNLSDAGVLSHQ